jgi:hypothetical protein
VGGSATTVPDCWARGLVEIVEAMESDACDGTKCIMSRLGAISIRLNGRKEPPLSRGPPPTMWLAEPPPSPPKRLTARQKHFSNYHRVELVDFWPSMGRRPNQLILEYFERGAKLEDASNRYQHTCKACGEKVCSPACGECRNEVTDRIADRVQFPKGRIDSLTNHLVKRCPALPMQDRQRALLQMHELPIPDNMAQTASTNTPGQSQMQHGQKMNLPFAPSKQLSALETLAEVSRQHLDLSGKRMADKQPSQAHNNASHAGLLDEFLIQDDRLDGSDMGGLSQGMDMSSVPAMPSMYQFNAPLHHSPTTSPHMDHMSLTSSTSMAHMVPSLVMAASAANDLMPLANGLSMESEMNLSAHGMQGMSDAKFFHPQGRGHWPNIQPNSLDPMLQDHSKEQMQSNDHLAKGMGPQRPLAMNTSPDNQTQFTTDFSMNQKPPKPKVRGRFSDSRRKEVQEVRKRGACIRCRMLKKPCSGENPCNTCKNVESARLWKQPCIRTRIAEEFDLYSAGLHSVLAYHATNQAKGQIRLDQTSGRIEVTHFPETGTFATFTPLKCQQTQGTQTADIDPVIFGTPASPDLELIDSDDDVSGKLDHYIKKMGGHFSDTEESTFMKVTVQIAKSVTSSSQDGLLTKALELWNLTRILTSTNFEWYIFSNPSLAPTMAPSILELTDLEHANRTPITAVEHASSYQLITMQLMGITEKRASCLARIVMNDLERRLLQRQQANPFETFLVAVILLACVERMCWLFRTWEAQPPTSTDEPSKQQPTAEDELASALQPSSPPASVQSPPPRNPRWPLDKPPSTFHTQGEKFSDILNMLLKMRGVPPKPSPRGPHGVLVVWTEDGADEKVREWYEGIGVTGRMLDGRRDARFEGKHAGEWECRFVGKIIRGD